MRGVRLFLQICFLPRWRCTVRNVVGIAILVASAGVGVACDKNSLALSAPGDRDGGTIGGAGGSGAGIGGAGGIDIGAGGDAGAATGGTPIAEECRSHDVDIPSATLIGALSVNGAPASPDPNTRLLLRNGLSDLVEIPFTGPSYSVRLAPGSYDVFFSATGPTAIAPANRFGRLVSSVVVALNDTTVLDVDVPETIVSGTITINGAPLDPGDAVGLSLRNAAGDTVPLATASNGSYAARVMPGTFDLYYASNAAATGSAAPLNQLARLATGVVIPAAPTTTLDVDVPSVTVAGGIAIGGVPAGSTNRGKVYLRNADGDVVRIAVANVPSFATRVVPGSYDLYFTGTEDAYSVVNQNTRLRTGVVIAAGGTTALDVQVPSATVEGTLLIEGEPPLATDAAHLVLRNAAGDYAQIPWNMDGHYTVHVVPGRYDLYYAKDNTAQSETPANQLARLRQGVVVAPAGITVLDIDVRSTLVTGALTINGLPADAGNSGIVSLRNADGDRVTIASTARSTFATRVVPGTYDLYYTRTASPANTTTEAPANHVALLRTGVVVAPGALTTLDVDIPSKSVSGAISVNGASAGAGDFGTLLLQSAAGDFATFAFTNGASYTARLIPGTYDLYFSNAGSVGETTPMNTFIKLRCFAVP
jgi:hypothetical protein